MSHVLPAFLLCAVAPVLAQQSPVLSLVPGAQDLPAPDWIKPGLRLTWYTAVGVSTSDSFVPAEPGQKDLYKIEHREGKFSIHKGGTEGSGHGYLESTVIGVDGRFVALETRAFILMGANPLDPPKMTGAWGSVVPAGACEGWIHPKALQALLARGVPGLQIGTCDWPFDGRRVTAVHVMSKEESWVFDAATGLVLHQSINARMPGRDPARLPSGFVLDGSGQSEGMTDLRGVRQLDLPWHGSALPPSVRGRQLRYQGAASLLQQGLPPMPTALSVLIEPLDEGPGWLRVKTTSQQGPAVAGWQQPAAVTVEHVYGTAMIGCMWLPPADLRRLRSGQRIDGADRWTHATTAVAFAGPAEGRQVVVLREESPWFRLDSHYDVDSGLLLRWVMNQVMVVGMSTEFDVRLAGR